MKISRFLFSFLAFAAISTANAASPKENYFTKKGFAWGLALSSSIDMTASGMSSIDIDGYFGYKNSFFQAIGVGASINMALNNSSRSYPIYAIIRTSFSNKPQLLFFEMRGGVSLNDLYSYTKQTGLYLHPAVGIRLASGKSWSSHFTLGYKFISRKDFSYDEGIFHCSDLSMGVVGIGISF
ncbi:MAG: hypothetical protein K2K88_04510 [Muribaculaceae bacterium]|nr:hypothetical protein [Muribaculaceae bacterium]MDE6352388.1 hypothetical protein [Muribaculaceae bacterium]MDE6643219.1 hypothetical protein [Muribaculaceae bacterium]MDE7093069.1 hypothetical protein [Muribaculaceae bacterium]